MSRVDAIELEASLSEPGDVSLGDYSRKVEVVLHDRSLSSLPQIHLAIAKGYHDLKAFERGIQYADRAIAISKRDGNGAHSNKVLEWSYLVKAECLRKLNKRFTELRMLAEYNRTVGGREDFRRQEATLLQEYTTRLHAKATILFPLLIVIVVALHRVLGWFDSAVLYISLLLPLIVLSAWSVLHSRSFKKSCSWLMTIGLYSANADVRDAGSDL